MLKHAVREALILILAAVGIALAVYTIRPDKIGTPPMAVTSDVVEQSSAKSGYSEISIKDALRLYEENSAIFADARHGVDFFAGHIKGAVNLFVDEQEVWLPDFFATTDPATVIVTYCDGEDCHLAPTLAELLIVSGFEKVYYLENGWTRWRESGFPVE